MRKITLIAALAAATAFTAPAMAAEAGTIQVKVLATGVLPDGKIDKIKDVELTPPFGATAAGALPASTKANDNVVPTVAIEYFATPNVSIETICCLTTHHVNGTGGLANTKLVKHVMILPATVTVKYHLDAGAVKPYVGVGPTMFFVLDEKPGATAKTLGVDRVKMSNSLGFALQAGVDVPVNDKGMGVSLDAKKYFVKPTATFYDSGVVALKTRHDLNPWVVSGGVYFKF